MGSVSDFIVNIIFKGKDQTSVPAASAASGMDKLARAAKFAAGAFAAIKSAQVAVDFLKLGAQAQAAETRLIAFAGSAGKAEAYIYAMGKASYGTMDRMTAMSYAARLVQMGIAKNTVEMEKNVAMAIRLGDQTMTVEQRMDTWTMMMANQSKLRLDTFGISSGEVTKRMKELTDAGKTAEEAFKQATFEIGTAALAKLGDQSNSTGNQIARLEVLFKDFKTSAAVAFAELVVDTGILEWLSEGLRGLPTTINQIIILWNAFYAAAKPVADAITAVGKAADWLMQHMNPMNEGFKAGTGLIDINKQALEGMGVEFNATSFSIEKALVKNDAFAASIRRSLGDTKAHTDSIENMEVALEKLPARKTVFIDYIATGIERLTGKQKMPTFQDLLPQKKKRQSGGLASGMTLVGERGPELVQLPVGSNVYNHNQSHAITNNYNMTVNTQADAPSVRQDFAMMRALYA